MMNYFKNLKIKVQLSILAVSTIFIILLVILIMYLNISGIIVKNNSEYTRDMFSQIKQTVSGKCDQYNRILTSIAYNRTIQSYLVETNLSKKVEQFLLVQNQVGNMMTMSDGIVDIMLIGNSGTHYFEKSNRSPELVDFIINLKMDTPTYYSRHGKFTNPLSS